MKHLIIGCAAAASLVMGVAPAQAASVVVVTPTNEQGWDEAATTSGGDVSFVADPDAPGGEGALQLTTDLTTAAKAQYLHDTSTPLRAVTDLSYWTKQVSAPFPEADPSYQLVMFLNGGTAGFSTLVFEPYWNPLQGPVVNNDWQDWDVDAGLFWSSRTVTCSGGIIVGMPGGPATYTLATINSLCPTAQVVRFGVNIGTFNPGYTVRTDLFDFNGTVYDFELFVAKSKDDCKDGGFADVTRDDGSSFKNQGQCIRFVNNGS